MSRYTQFYIIKQKSEIDTNKMNNARQWIKETIELFDDYVMLVSEKWKLIKGAKILFGDDYEIEKYYREYSVYVKHLVSIIKATKSVLNTNYYRDLKKDKLITSILDIIEVLK